MEENRLTARTNIDLPTERAGFFPDEQWYVQRLGSSSLITGHKINLVIGQGEVLMTPLQIAAFYAAIANDGLWNQPYLFARTIGTDRTSDHEKDNIYSVTESGAVEDLSRYLTISPETLGIIQEGLFKAANESGGTALAARIRNGRVYGKTGTAENPGSKFPHAWFAGYAKWQQPEIALTIILENVEDGSGGRTAAPLAGRIFNFYQENVRGISVSQID
jgi:penicillin-binding protein 2